MVRTNPSLRYFKPETLNQSLKTAFRRALTVDVTPNPFRERVRSVICIDSKGTKCREGGFIVPHDRRGIFTVNFIDPLMADLERDCISRGFLENINANEMLRTYKQSMHFHKPTIGLNRRNPKGSFFLPFFLNRGLQSCNPYLAPATTEAVFNQNQAKFICSTNQPIHDTLRSFSQHWNENSEVEPYKDLNREIGELTMAFNKFIAQYLIEIGRPVLVQSQLEIHRGMHKYKLALKPADLENNTPRFTSVARNPFAFLNAVQLSLALRGKPNLYEGFPQP